MADRGITLCCWLAALLVAGICFWIIGDVIVRGAGSVSWSFLTTAPQDGGSAGGIAPILVANLLILLVCLVVSVPLGTATAALLAEFTRQDNRFALFVRRSLDVLAGVPSIVFGLFGNAFFCVFLGMRRSLLAGGLTLACMVLPLLIRAAEEGFRSVSDSHRRAAAALGLSRGTTFFKVVLPIAVPGIIVGLILGVGRALAETAALLHTSGFVDRMPSSLWDSGRSLSIHIYAVGRLGTHAEQNANASAVVLIVLLLLINITVSVLTTRLLQRRIVT